MGLEEAEFVDAISRVHAIRDHAVKQENEHLGLPDSPQSGDDKVEKFGEWLWRYSNPGGRRGFAASSIYNVSAPCKVDLNQRSLR